MDTNTEHTHSDTESMDIDNDYTTYDSLHNPQQALLVQTHKSSSN